MDAAGAKDGKEEISDRRNVKVSVGNHKITSTPDISPGRSIKPFGQALSQEDAS